MRRIRLIASILLLNTTAFAQGGSSSGYSFEKFVADLADLLFSDIFQKMGLYDESKVPFVVLWLVVGALFFTVRMGFVNFWGLKHAFDLVRGKFDTPTTIAATHASPEEESEILDHAVDIEKGPEHLQKGEVSHFQALTTALSATVGLGNIAGVAVAISIGGPGATFWMILAGILGMSSKFVECTLGVKYRKINQDGEVSGGPMYYLSRGLAKRGPIGGILGKGLAILFAIMCVFGSFGGGNMFQSNQAFLQFSNAFGMGADTGLIFGFVMAILVGIVIIGGIRSIAKVTDKIVPFMAGFYVLFALIIIGMNITNVGQAFEEIFSGAFSPAAGYGGIIGVMIQGFKRAAFSNEAGIGSASIAHSASRTDEPVSEGIVALLEPLVDTVIICTMTALVLIFTGFADGQSGLEGAELTSAAFSSVFPWFNFALVIAIILFAFSTMVSWSYYGLKAWTYLFGGSKVADILYKIIFLGFVILGCTVDMKAVVDFSDIMILCMALPNILGLYIMSGEVRGDLKSYFDRVKSGAIERFD